MSPSARTTTSSSRATSPATAARTVRQRAATGNARWRHRLVRICGRAAADWSSWAGTRRPACLSVLVRTHASRPRMLIFGAVDFAGALSEIGRFLGYRVTVWDARPVFATAARFPYADEVVADRPHRYLPLPRWTPVPPSASSRTTRSRTSRCCAWRWAARGPRRRDALAPHPRPASGPAAGGRRTAGAPVPPALPDRPRPRRPHPRGDGRLHRRGDRRPHPSRLGNAPDAERRAHPPPVDGTSRSASIIVA